MDSILKNFIDSKDFEGLKNQLSQNPELANEGIPFDDMNLSVAHPLHRICDGVFLKKYTDRDALHMATIFITHGADINGGHLIDGKDTPLIAAASLHADQVALYYIKSGANVNHVGCEGGTALHWACWSGRYNLVKNLIRSGAKINKKDGKTGRTPLFWAILGAKKGGVQLEHAIKCIKILIGAGSIKNLMDEGNEHEILEILSLLNEQDRELKYLLKENM